MTFDATTTIAEGSLEQVAMRARKLAEERRTGSRKHFLDAYAEHLEAMRRGRSTK